MKLIDVVKAYLAADALYKETLPYALAYALVRVKREAKEAFAFFSEKEMELVAQYAKRDEKENVELAPNGGFIFAEPSKRMEYMQKRAELMETEIDFNFQPIKTAPPEKIKPEWLESLAGFILFE